MGWIKDKGSNKFQLGGQVPVAPRVPGLAPQVPMYKKGGEVERTAKEKRELNKKIRAENKAKRKERRAEIKDINVKAKDWDKEGAGGESKAERKRILKKRARRKYRANKIKTVKAMGGKIAPKVDAEVRHVGKMQKMSPNFRDRRRS
jgi:hypothetical protein